jgi:heme/copper-type cytochrome/quinol oxidase subunit 4
LGLLIDSFWQRKRRVNGIELKNNANGKELKTQLINRIAIPIYVFIGIFVATYAFVFIFDAKAGIGMAVILSVFWLGIGLLVVLKYAASEQDKRRRRTFLTKSLIAFILVTTSLFWFTAQHIKKNPGWGSLFEDMAIGAQIDKYSNWTEISGGVNLPLRKDGTAVASNTYERVALATLGMRLIKLNPIGSGTFKSLIERAKKIEPNYRNHPYTHSAWIDLGLSFGLPGLLFLPIAFISILICAMLNSQIRFRATIITMAIAMLILYLVGEYAFGHGIEILFYVAGLLWGLVLVDYSKPRLHLSIAD